MFIRDKSHFLATKLNGLGGKVMISINRTYQKQRLYKGNQVMHSVKFLKHLEFFGEKIVFFFISHFCHIIIIGENST